MHSDVYKSVWFKFDSAGMIILYSVFWYYSNWSWPWFKVTVVQESKDVCGNKSHKSFQSIWMESGVLLRLVNVMNLVSFYFVHQYSRKRSLLMCFCWKTAMLACMQTFTDHFQTWYHDRELSSTFLVSVWIALTFSHVCIYMRNRKLWCSFSGKLSMDLDEIQFVDATC